MKIAIASDDGKVISSHFGRTKGFVVFEVEGKEIKERKYLPNTFTGHARGLEGEGHGFDRHKSIIEALGGCQAVISHGMGARIYNDLKAAGIGVCITDETDVEKALNLYLEGRLVDRPDMRCEHYRHG